MGILVDRNTPPVAVRFGNEPDDGLEVNTVFVKAKFSLGDTIQIEESSYRLEFSKSADGQVDQAQPYRVPMSPVGQMVTALRHAVTSWDGPLFAGIRYRRPIWDDIDVAECEWWIRLVHERINELNSPRTDAPAQATNDPNEKK